MSSSNMKYTERVRSLIARNSSVGLSGQQWLEQVCDPFPDDDQGTLIGMPDENQAQTVVMKVRQGFTLARPTSIPSTSQWDVLIFFDGNLRVGGDNAAAGRLSSEPRSAIAGEFSYQVETGASISPGFYPMQPLTAYAAPTGTSMFPIMSALPWTESNADRFFGLNVEQYLQNRSRLIGGAVEIHDTTPELYKSGSITIADVTSTVDRVVWPYKDDGTNVVIPVGSIRFNAPPATLAQATLLPGSRTWGAKEGCYAVLKMSKVENPFVPNEMCVPCWSDSYPALPQTSYPPGSVVLGPSTAGVVVPPIIDYTTYSGVNIATYYGAPALPAPFDIKCIFLSGLDPNATFRVNFNVLLEVAPDLENQQLLVLAKAAPPLDLAALEIYSKIVSELPCGVPVCENASGEWFRKVLGFLERAASPIGKTLGMLGVPGATLVGDLVSKGAGAGKVAMDKKSASKAGSRTALIPAKKK